MDADAWDELTGVQQAKLLAYHQIKQHDQTERDVALAGGSKGPRPTPPPKRRRRR